MKRCAGELGVFAGRERLRLVRAARAVRRRVAAYMNVLRDTAALKLQESNIAVLSEQLRQTRERYPSDRSRSPTSPRRKRGLPTANRSPAWRARARRQRRAYRKTIGVEPGSSPRARRSKACCRNRARGGAHRAEPNIPSFSPRCTTPTRRSRHQGDRGGLHAETVHRRRDIHETETAGIGNRNIGGHVRRASQCADLRRRRHFLARAAGQGTRRATPLDVDVARAEVLALVRANWGALQAAKT